MTRVRKSQNTRRKVPDFGKQEETLEETKRAGYVECGWPHTWFLINQKVEILSKNK